MINTSAPAAAFPGAVRTRDLGWRNRDVTPCDCPLLSLASCLPLPTFSPSPGPHWTASISLDLQGEKSGGARPGRSWAQWGSPERAVPEGWMREGREEGAAKGLEERALSGLFLLPQPRWSGQGEKC